MRVVLGGGLEPSQLVATPLEPHRWHRSLLGQLEAIEHQTLRTYSGWPIDLYTAAGQVSAFFRFFEYSAHVAIPGELTDDLLDTLRSAEPDWRADGLVVCLAELVA